MNTYTFVWITLMVVMILVECLTLGLTTIWFAAGALVSAVLSCYDVNIFIQIIAFLIVSIGLLALLRPFAKNIFNNNIKGTNIALLIGKEAIVYEKIDSLKGTGRVRINGQEWMAKSDDIIPENSKVTITGIQGVSLIVK